MIIKNSNQANNFIVGYLIFFISCLFIPYYFSVFSVLIASLFNELYLFWKTEEKDYKFDMLNIGYMVAGMLPALLIKIFG